MALDLATPLAPLFIPMHALALLLGLYGAYWASNHRQPLWMVAFGAWTLAEIIYLTVHLNLDVVTQLTAHVLEELLLLVAFGYALYKLSMK